MAHQTFKEVLLLKPEKFFLLFVIGFWLIVNFPPWSMYGGKSIALMVFDWGTVGASRMNVIFPLTYGIALFTLIFSLARFKRILKLSWDLSILLAITAPFAFTGTFEEVYQNLAYYVRPELFHTNAPGQLLLASWILLGFASFPFWKTSKKFYMCIVMDIIGFALWASIGYPQIYEINGLTAFAIALNLFTKFAFGMTFIALIYEGTKADSNSMISRQSLPTQLHLMSEDPRSSRAC